MPAQPRGKIPAGVRVVLFDAVGTLLHPEPSAGTSYALVGQTFGSQLAPDEIRRRFSRAFKEQESHDASQGHRTDEARELARWRAIVSQVLDDVHDLEGCFRALYDHFSRPACWRCEPGAGSLLDRLRSEGYRVGLASNFDHRLRAVIDGLPDMHDLDHLFISSEVGWKKPARRFFSTVCQVLQLPPQQILLVGDDLDNDHLGASAADLHSLLFDPARTSNLPPEQCLSTLEELLPVDV